MNKNLDTNQYRLSFQDWLIIHKYFCIRMENTYVREIPQFQFIEYQVIDINTEQHLFSFYSHEAIIIVELGKDNYWKVLANDILKKNPDMPPVAVLAAISKKSTKKKLFNKNRI